MEKKKMNVKKTKNVNKGKTKEVEVTKKCERDKRNLIVGLLYLICSFLWFIGGAAKMIVSESYIVDLILGLVWLILSYIYFVKFKNSNK